MTTLLWIRDHYDANKDRYIDSEEMHVAEEDFFGYGTISEDEFFSTEDAYRNHTRLPAYDPCPVPTCSFTIN